MHDVAAVANVAAVVVVVVVVVVVAVVAVVAVAAVDVFALTCRSLTWKSVFGKQRAVASAEICSTNRSDGGFCTWFIYNLVLFRCFFYHLLCEQQQRQLITNCRECASQVQNN